MRKFEKEEILSYLQKIRVNHKKLIDCIENEQIEQANDILITCQSMAIEIGEFIESIENENSKAVKLVEKYCEDIYRATMTLIDESTSKMSLHQLNNDAEYIETEVRAIPTHLEIAFLPYKASMWDSLESIWIEAEEDTECEAYVVPIPYYDKLPDGTLGEEHYEADLYPEYVPVYDYKEYKIEERRPDIIYIHNPYDGSNFVTTVAPQFYSKELTKYTEKLVYVPYYATSGGMSDAQALLPAYFYADYIVIQSEKYKKYFDMCIPEEKFLIMGSPKFDRVIRFCNEINEVPQIWEEIIQGRKVYFYNTSLAGMLDDTKEFLLKMEYVFRTFTKHKDACILWRPHPLFESTLASMRPDYKPIFDYLKNYFLSNRIGIYDDSPEIDTAISCSDAYIGDAGTSVTSLFGVVGKPIFVLNNRIHALPEADDWRGDYIRPMFSSNGEDRYQVAPNNTLWYSEKNDYYYKYYMNLHEAYQGGAYYLRAFEVGELIYVVPRNAQNILVIQNRKILRTIELEHFLEQPNAFRDCKKIGHYLILIPFWYPYLVRLDLHTEEITYGKLENSFHSQYIEGQWLTGGYATQDDKYLWLSAVSENRFARINVENFEIEYLLGPGDARVRTQTIVADDTSLWLLPMRGTQVIKWNPQAESARDFEVTSADFTCYWQLTERVCDDHPFENIAILKKDGKRKVLFAPLWGNAFLVLDEETGEVYKWNPPFEVSMKGKNGYYLSHGYGNLIVSEDAGKRIDYKFWSASDRVLYQIDLDSLIDPKNDNPNNENDCMSRRIGVEFDASDARLHACGFGEESDWIKYCIKEDAFHTLEDFLNNTLEELQFQKEKAISAYEQINVSPAGDCGKKVHNYVKRELLN